MSKETISHREFFRQLGLLGMYYPLRMIFGEGKVENYDEYLWRIASTVPDIGGRENYNKPLGAGIGFATLHNSLVRVCANRGVLVRDKMEKTGTTFEDLTQNEKNLYLITAQGKQSIFANLTPDKEWFSPQDALGSGSYNGLIATRSPEDVGAKYLVYRVSPPQKLIRSMDFLGSVLVVDCASREDWDENLSNAVYMQNGWDNPPLPWAADLPEPLMRQLPVGITNDPADVTVGRPGVLLVSEDTYYSFNLH